jgi:hypothetical protein
MEWNVMATLADLVQDPASGIDAIAAHLDALTHEQRLEAVYSLRKKGQKALFEKAAAAPPITLEHFVPRDREPLEEVIHFGKNTLPAFKLFQKRFCRPDGAELDKLYGYNEGLTRGLIGPGYFVAHPTAGHEPVWQERGAIVVNYFEVPDDQVVDGWPKIKPNTSGLQVFVYNKTRDFMRKVSEHVSIGAAFRVEKALDAYFILCRQDEANGD